MNKEKNKSNYTLWEGSRMQKPRRSLNVTLCVHFLPCLLIKHLLNFKGKSKGHPRTGREGLEGQ